MKFNFVFLKVLLFSFLLFSCGAGWNDVILDLGSNYHYMGEGSPYNYIFYGKKSKSGAVIEKIIILTNVESYNFDKNFIVVKQEPNLEGIKDYVIYFDKRYNYLSDTLNTQKGNFDEKLKKSLVIADSIVKTNEEYSKLFKNKFNYYIINKVSKNKYGPFSKAEFEKNIKKLKVSISLK